MAWGNVNAGGLYHEAFRDGLPQARILSTQTFHSPQAHLESTPSLFCTGNQTQPFTLLPNPCHIYWRESNRLALFTSTVLVWNLISPESVAFENPKRRDEAKIGQDRTGVVGHLSSTRGRWKDGRFLVTGEERF